MVGRIDPLDAWTSRSDFSSCCFLCLASVLDHNQRLDGDAMSEQERQLFELVNSWSKSPIDQEAAYTALEDRLIMDAICRHCGQRNGEHSYHRDLCPVIGSRTKFSLYLSGLENGRDGNA